MILELYAPMMHLNLKQQSKLQLGQRQLIKSISKGSTDLPMHGKNMGV